MKDEEYSHLKLSAEEISSLARYLEAVILTSRADADDLAELTTILTGQPYCASWDGGEQYHIERTHKP